MAVSIEKGKIYTATMVRSGTSSRGDWEMVKVKDKNKEITIWPDNKPTGLSDGDEFEIVDITGVKYGARKRTDGRWQDDVSCTAILKQSSTSSFNFNVDSIDDGEMPWSMDDSPFSVDEEDQLPL